MRLRLAGMSRPTDLQALIEDEVKSGSIPTEDLGGPLQFFDLTGRATLSLLLEHGLCPFHRVLALGCGALGLGYWLIRLLDEGCYYGIEPDKFRIEIGKKHIAGQDIIDQKKPHFSDEGGFDLTVFDQQFEFVVARSIWTHASKQHVSAIIESLPKCLAPNGVLFASYWPALDSRESYRGEGWTTR